MTYAHLLPILVNDGAIMPKQIQPARFPYHPKHDPNAIYGYHFGHVGNSIENRYPLRPKFENSSTRSLNTWVLRFMYKFLFLCSNRLCNIKIKDITLECLWPIMGHCLLLLLQLSRLILGHPISYLEFNMARLLII